ncbi:hypothetical protein [Halorubrum ezzemoulense]|nr:hypothetical protein [Halorubrum ezzemoulense]MDB9252938.1 hypothetical protein [Halorubrum ezzemoulense]
MSLDTTSGYSIHFYATLGKLFWVAVIGVYLGSVTIILTISNKWRGSYSFGLLAAGMVTALITLLPLILDYFAFGRADAMTHVGLIRDILKTGEISASNKYPSMHLLGTILVSIFNIRIYTLTLFIPGLVFLYYTFSMITLLNLHHGPTPARIFVGLLLLVPMFRNQQMLFSPWSFGFMLIGFQLLVFSVTDGFVRKGGRWMALSMGAMFTGFFHPLGYIVMLLIFAAATFDQKIIRNRGIERTLSSRPITNNINYHYIILLVGFILYLLWYSNYGQAIVDAGLWALVEVGVLSNIGLESSSTLNDYTSVLSRTTPSIIDIIQTLITRYGQYLFLFTIAGVGWLLLLFQRRDKAVRSYVGVFLVFTVLAILGLVASGVTAYGYSRILLPLSTVSVIIIYGVIRYSNNNSLPAHLYRIALVTFIVIILLTSTFNLYKSPINDGSNQQVTQSELGSIEWFVNHRVPQQDIYQLGIWSKHYAHAIQGTQQTVWPEGLPPPHFNATEDRPKSYLLITEEGRETYPSIYPKYRQYWRYTPEDFKRLNVTPTTKRIYDNGNVRIYDRESFNVNGSVVFK